MMKGDANMATSTRPEVGAIYNTGDINPVNGEFVCVACEDSGQKHTVKIAKGDKFPECENVETTWRLMSYT